MRAMPPVSIANVASRLAISSRWKVHYFKADMADSPENPTKDAAFLNDMAGFMGARGMAALERINAALDLDYCGIDFAVNVWGDISFFEVPLSDDRKWDYRRPAFDKAFSAVRTMLSNRAAGAVTGKWSPTHNRELPSSGRCTESHWSAYFLIGNAKRTGNDTSVH
jgi:hypothetical protein